MSETKLSDRASFIVETPLASRDVKTPKGTYRVQELMGGALDAYQQSMIVGKGRDRDVNMKNARAKLIVLSVVDENGKRIFQDSDVAIVARQGSRFLDIVFKAAQELSGLTDEDVKSMTENLEPAQSGEDISN